ncbi:alcohol dehydrogenase catalytic domain-containing protein [Streptomyces sp. NPDC005017]|uniref:alcohol dehydrogenase catalytic domain-containing protein n=1 Tax=Streptomyces sp. NPDC005017 TaxID=3364706 RepID=UPI003692766E
MRALVYHSAGRISWDVVEDPVIEAPTDAVVRVEAATVSGRDLRVVRGEVPQVEPGTVLGHEAVGEVLEVGPAVTSLRPGDRVVVSSVSACGGCAHCRADEYVRCEVGGRLLGLRIDGTQADLVRVPYADRSTHRWPASLRPEVAVLLSEVLPTACERGVRAGGVAPGQTVVVVGAGPVGLATVALARVYSPRRVIAVDLSRPRLTAARRVGADAAYLPGTVISELAKGPGADVVVEAAGNPESFLLSTRLVRRGGTVAVVGSHTEPAPLHLETLWNSDITLRTGQVDTRSVPWLIELMECGRLDAAPLVTGTRGLADMVDVYDEFAHGTASGALKLVALRDGSDADYRPRLPQAPGGGTAT